jgi:hypothetical protein
MKLRHAASELCSPSASGSVLISPHDWREIKRGLTESDDADQPVNLN